MRTWSSRRWLAAAASSVLWLLLLGLPTAVIPNPVFGRAIEAPLWSYVTLAVTAVLGGLLMATYVKEPVEALAAPAVGSEAAAGSGSTGEVAPDDARRFTLGGMLAFFAVGCPTCNKLVLIALGSTGAVTWFEPVQPLLAVGGVAVLVYALRRRLRSEVSCQVPVARQR